MNKLPPPLMDWTPERVSAFWNDQNQHGVVYFSSKVGENIYHLLKSFLKNKTRILDYGCGDGSMMKILMENGKQACGVDFSKSAVEIVNQEFEGDKNFLGAFTMDSLPLIKEKFDAVFVFEVVEHLTDEGLNELIKNLSNFLNIDGLLVLTTPNNEKLDDSYVFCPNCKLRFHRMQHVRSWNTQSLKLFFEEKGFKTIQTFVTTLRPEGKLMRVIKRIIKTLLKGKIIPVNLIWIGTPNRLG